jgi:hypothetical protein
MTNLLILSVLVGAVLGMRLRVLIILPVIGFAFVTIAGIGAARSDALSLIATVMVLTAISLQLGYLLGSAARFVMVAARISRRYKIQKPAPELIWVSSQSRSQTPVGRNEAAAATQLAD